MSHLKEKCQKVLSQLQLDRLIKYKKIFLPILLCVGVIVSFNLVAKALQPGIREKEIASVVKAPKKNAQVTYVTKESELKRLGKIEEPVILGFMDRQKNKEYETVHQWFGSKEFKKLDLPVYVFEPIYDLQDYKKQYDIQHKNTLMYVAKGKEVGRYGFDTLQNGDQSMTEEMKGIVNPIIPQRKPVRVEVIEKTLMMDDNGQGVTKTSEVEFE